MRTWGWLGTRRMPGQFVMLWIPTLVSRVAGRPPIRQVNAARRWRCGPITIPEATPSATPGLSPFVIGIIVAMLCAGAQQNRTLYAAGTPMGPSAMFGYGIGVGTGVGV